jgi:hypothetical protein
LCRHTSRPIRGGPAAAAEAALRKFGDPARIGQEYRHAGSPRQERHSLFPRTAVRHGLGWFGGAALLFLGLFRGRRERVW